MSPRGFPLVFEAGRFERIEDAISCRTVLTWAILGIGALLAPGCGGSPRLPDEDGIDVLVVAPHPDDESLGCGGLLAQTWAQGRRAKVVILTNGDGNAVTASALTGRPKEALVPDDYLAVARLRQTQARRAVAELGGKAEDLVFLGYPDTGLKALHESPDAGAWTQPLTRRSETYGLVQADYHSAAHGRAAPYTHGALMSDLKEILRALRPRRIFVTHESDRHPDHQAACAFVRDAARAVGGRGSLSAYMIHGQATSPAPVRLRLTEAAVQAKTRALHVYLSGFPPEAGDVVARKRTQFLSFASGEEAFWPVPPE